MQIVNSNFSLLFIFVFVLGACKDPGPIPSRMWNCHADQNWTESPIFDHVLGKWEFTNFECPLSGDEEGELAFIEITFLSDSTLIFQRESEAPITATWRLEIADGDLYGFDTEPAIAQLRGRLLFCDDLMECEASYLDGCDHLFTKME